MDLILNYGDDEEKKPFDNLLYLAKPVYGGWVTFTAHLSHKYKIPIYKIGKRNETFKRDYGYECKYQNINIDRENKCRNELMIRNKITI